MREHGIVLTPYLDRALLERIYGTSHAEWQLCMFAVFVKSAVQSRCCWTATARVGSSSCCARGELRHLTPSCQASSKTTKKRLSFLHLADHYQTWYPKVHAVSRSSLPMPSPSMRDTQSSLSAARADASLRPPMARTWTRRSRRKTDPAALRILPTRPSSSSNTESMLVNAMWVMCRHVRGIQHMIVAGAMFLVLVSARQCLTDLSPRLQRPLKVRDIE